MKKVSWKMYAVFACITVLCGTLSYMEFGSWMEAAVCIVWFAAVLVLLATQKKKIDQAIRMIDSGKVSISEIVMVAVMVFIAIAVAVAAPLLFTPEPAFSLRISIMKSHTESVFSDYILNYITYSVVIYIVFLVLIMTAGAVLSILIGHLICFLIQDKGCWDVSLKVWINHCSFPLAFYIWLSVLMGAFDLVAFSRAIF